MEPNWFTNILLRKRTERKLPLNGGSQILLLSIVRKLWHKPFNLVG